MIWTAFASELPEFDTALIILFRSGHIEDATCHAAPDGDGWVYCLSDGEQINDQPTHWMPRPADPVQ